MTSLIWHDEFDGPAGSAPNPENWVPQLGGLSADGQIQVLTDSRENSYLDGKGHLAISALKTSTGFTSAYLQSTFSQQYGVFSAWIKTPGELGIWPAFWMVGKNISKVHWPACGEIDILEQNGHELGVSWSHIHGPGFTGSHIGEGLKLKSGAAFSAAFHDYAVEWRKGEISFLIDGEVLLSYSATNLKAGYTWPFDAEGAAGLIRLSLAVGGGWVGPPNASTVFPATMLVDWVRVYA